MSRNKYSRSTKILFELIILFNFYKPGKGSQGCCYYNSIAAKDAISYHDKVRLKQSLFPDEITKLRPSPKANDFLSYYRFPILVKDCSSLRPSSIYEGFTGF